MAGGYACVGVGLWEISQSFPKFCCESNTALKKSLCFFFKLIPA